MNMDRVDRALEFAAVKHRAQKRKGTDIPYISHPFGVGMILLQAGATEDAVIAGILHDTLEDTETTEEEILSHFGLTVLKLVQGASEPHKEDPWEVRKEHTLESLKTASLEQRMVVCADKLHNLRSIRRNLEAMGDLIWQRFNRGYEQQKWYYSGLVKSLEAASQFPLLNELKHEVEEVVFK